MTVARDYTSDNTEAAVVAGISQILTVTDSNTQNPYAASSNAEFGNSEKIY